MLRHALSRGDLPTKPADYLHLRVKDLPAAELLCRARAMRQAWAKPLLINDRVDVCLAAGADGVHLPSRRMAPLRIKKCFGAKLLVGVSCHSIQEVQVAEQEGADYVFLSPIFSPLSKKVFSPPLGLEVLSQAQSLVKIPVLALGGICENTEEKCRLAGVAGFAAISFFFPLASPDR
ncbi:MAG: thiamine phosphate synthase [Bryobacter sp.]|nr:thiamine phosphate synthase [Bryobacter sp.]